MTLALRRALRDTNAQDVIKHLYKDSETEKSNWISLPSVTKAVGDYCSRPCPDYNNQNIPDYCFNQPDLIAISELEKTGAIAVDEWCCLGDDDSWYSKIMVKDKLFIKKMLSWIQTIDNVIDYGIFSLDTLCQVPNI